jgi:hypothetical protein
LTLPERQNKSVRLALTSWTSVRGEPYPARNLGCELRPQGLGSRGACQACLREVGVDTYYAQYEGEAYAQINAVPEAKNPCGEAVLRRVIFRTFF